MDDPHIDFTFGLSWESLVVFETFKGLASQDEVYVVDERPLHALKGLELVARPHYEAREKGILMLVGYKSTAPMRSGLIHGRTLMLWFARHRSTDALFIQSCETDANIWTLAMEHDERVRSWTQESYDKRVYYEEDALRHAAWYLFTLIGTFYTEQRNKVYE
jgi:hypothetical protein